MSKLVFTDLAASIIQHTNDGIITKTLDGTITSWNAAAERLFGYSAAEAIGKSISMLIPPIQRAEEQQILATIARGTSIDHIETIRVRKDGSSINVSIAISPLFDKQNNVIGASKIARDITQQKQAEARLKHYEALVRYSNDAIVSKTLDGVVTSWNPAAERLFGYRADEVINQPLLAIVPPDLIDEEKLVLARLDRGEIINHIETVRIHKDGRRVDISMTISPIIDEFGKVIGASNISRDISVRKLEEAIVTDMAYHDPLTDLANRRLLTDRLARTMFAEERTKRHGALIYIDLDNFKQVNDTAGHDIGDQLLVGVARKIESVVRQNDTVSRLGGDEFAILLDGLSDVGETAAAEAQIVAAKILETLRTSYQIKHMTFDCSPSIGVALFRGREISVTEVLKRADQAMYQAKLSGKNRVRFVGLS
ncbi:MAG: PAS domain S-box protein [Candidatus Obscuribacterales bacterium]|nr:PAS domain S-box protein [Steroidobacteraceae bacterium]